MDRAKAAEQKLQRALHLVGSRLTFEMGAERFGEYPVKFYNATRSNHVSRRIDKAWLEDEWHDVPAGLRTLLDGVREELWA